MAKPTLQELRQKYSQACYEIGDLEFKLKQIPGELDTAHSRLNMIFRDLVRATQEEQKKTPQAPQEPVQIETQPTAEQ